MKEITLVLMIWIGDMTGWNIDFPIPEVRFLPRAEIIKKTKVPNAIAMYHNKVTYFSDSMTLEYTRERALHIHELVHYLQHMNNITYRCKVEREAVAYKLQYLWLQKFNMSSDFVYSMMNKECDS